MHYPTAGVTEALSSPSWTSFIKSLLCPSSCGNQDWICLSIFQDRGGDNRDKGNPSNSTNECVECAVPWDGCCGFSGSPDLLPKQAEGALQSSGDSGSNKNTPSVLLKEFPSAESPSVSCTSLSFKKKKNDKVKIKGSSLLVKRGTARVSTGRHTKGVAATYVLKKWHFLMVHF